MEGELGKSEEEGKRRGGVCLYAVHTKVIGYNVWLWRMAEAPRKIKGRAP